MKTFGPALIILSAGLGLSLASPQFGRGGDPCQYRCTDGGGCEVRYIGPPRSGKIKGSCFPNSFGGSCSGTPRECQHCNQAITCQEEEDFPRTQTGTRTPPRSRPVQPREPKSIGQSSLFEVVAGGTCVTICDNWPFAQCKVQSKFRPKKNKYFTGWTAENQWRPPGSNMYQPLH